MRKACVLLVILFAPVARAQTDCSEAKAQHDRDKIALERQQAANARALDELDKWTKENQAAQRAALQTARNLLLRGIVGKFAEQLSLDIEEVEKRTARIRRVDPAFLADLRELITRRDRLMVLVGGSKPLLDEAKDLQEIYDDLRAKVKEAHEIAAEMAKLVAKMAAKEAAKEIFEEVALPRLVNGFEREFLTKKALPFLGEAKALGDAVVDYGYSATEWTLSRQRILDQYKLADADLRAMDSVTCQYERSVARLAQCRGEHPAPVRALCRVAASKCGKPPFEIPGACRGKDRGACEAAIVAPCTRYLNDYMAARGRRVTSNNCAPCAREWASELVPLTP